MDEAAKKKALRMVPYGLHIGGVTDGETENFFLLTWITQCSFKPPLFAAAVHLDSRNRAMIGKTGLLAVNLLGAEQKALAETFLKRAEVADGKANGYPYSKRGSGAPVLDDAAAFFVGRTVAMMEEGDHTLFVLEVVDAGHRRDAPPLTHAIAGLHYAG